MDKVNDLAVDEESGFISYCFIDKAILVANGMNLVIGNISHCVADGSGCIDMQTPATQTQSLTRLVLLMLANSLIVQLSLVFQLINIVDAPN